MIRYKQLKVRSMGYRDDQPTVLSMYPRTLEITKQNNSFPGSSDGKRVCLQRGRSGFDPWVGKIPWRRKWQPTPILLPGKLRGWRSLVGYSPWDLKESDTSEQLHWFIHCGKLDHFRKAQTASREQPLTHHGTIFLHRSSRLSLHVRGNSVELRMMP